VAVPYPVHWAVSAVWRRELAKCWVADCGDPYMGDESDSFRKLFYFKYVEKWMFRKADYISIPIETAKPAYYPEFHSKIVVIPQGLNFNEFKQDQQKYTSNNVSTFAYAGSFIPNNRDPRSFLEFLVGIEADFRFYIFTTTPALVEPYAAISGGRILISRPIPRRELIYRLSQMDFLVNIDNSTRVQMPSKLIDYYLTGRPVLSLPSGKVNEVEVNQFLSGDYASQFIFTTYDQYKIENVSAQFLTLMQESGS
jgi:hypothetical protein